jgi:branched-chain amino acid transport system permease protein
VEFFLQQCVNGIALGSVFALYALGFSLVFANLKAFHVAHAGIFTWGAIFAWSLTDKLGWPFVAVVPVVAVMAGALNVVTYFLAIRHLEHRRHRDLAVFVSSLAAGIVLTELAIRYLDHKTVRLPIGLITPRRWDLGLVQVSNVQLVMIGSAAVVFVVLRWIIGSTELGREMQAVAHDREAAAMLGVNVNAISAVVFFLSGAIAGIGASLVGVAFNIIDAHVGHVYLVLAIAILVIGGLGSVAGGFAGGLIVGVASSLTTGYISSSYRDVVVFGLLLVVLIARPSGLFRSANVIGRA